MAFWIQVRCDTFGPKCLSKDNVGPTHLSGGTDGDLRNARRNLLATARSQGWKTTVGGHQIACPNCREPRA